MAQLDLVTLRPTPEWMSSAHYQGEWWANALDPSRSLGMTRHVELGCKRGI